MLRLSGNLSGKNSGNLSGKNSGNISGKNSGNISGNISGTPPPPPLAPRPLPSREGGRGLGKPSNNSGNISGKDLLWLTVTHGWSTIKRVCHQSGDDNIRPSNGE